VFSSQVELAFENVTFQIREKIWLFPNLNLPNRKDYLKDTFKTKSNEETSKANYSSSTQIEVVITKKYEELTVISY